MIRTELREHIFKLLFQEEFNQEEDMQEHLKYYFMTLENAADKDKDYIQEILRLAVYEMKWDEEVPVGVAINEAVELAKRFSGGDSPSFINGVLGKIARSADGDETK